MKKEKRSLKDLICDELMAVKLMSYEDIKQLAERNHYKVSTAERRLRAEDDWDIPAKKLNRFKKPIKENERIFYYKWDGGTTVLN